MALVKVGKASAFEPGSATKIEEAGKAILVANVGGTFCAIANACPHRTGDLSRGVIADGTVTCPEHGARFDLRSGRNVGKAKFLFWKISVNDVPAFPVTVEGGDILAEIG